MSDEVNYIIVNGVSSMTITGLEIDELPSPVRPKARIEEEEVLGIDGSLTTTDDTYCATTKVCRVYYDGGDYDSLANFFQESGTVVFSNLPNRYYDYKIMSEIPFDQVKDGGWCEFNVDFRCQPFGYTLNNSMITIDCSKYLNKTCTISNLCTRYSKPIVTIYGTGNINIFINGNQISLINVEEYITINSVKLRTYKDLVRQNEKKIGDYPALLVGDNIVSWSGTVTKIEIIPNWRYLI